MQLEINIMKIQVLGQGVVARKWDFWPGLGLPRPKAIVVIPKSTPVKTIYGNNQSAEGAGGLGIIRDNKLGESE